MLKDIKKNLNNNGYSDDEAYYFILCSLASQNESLECNKGKISYNYNWLNSYSTTTLNEQMNVIEEESFCYDFQRWLDERGVKYDYAFSDEVQSFRGTYRRVEHKLSIPLRTYNGMRGKREHNTKGKVYTYA